MRELLPGFEKEAPLDAEVTKEAVYFLTEKSKFRLPISRRRCAITATM